MTERSQVLDVSHRKVWLLAGPIILSNLSVPLVGAVDTAVVGHLPGPEAIGAVALGALVFSFLYWGFGFLRMGTTGFVAQAYGAGDHDELAHILFRVLLMALCLGFAVILLGAPIIDFALYLIDSSEAVERLASDYALVRLWSSPAVLCTYAFTGVFIGLHDTRSAFVMQLAMNIVNVLLSLLFVLVFEWGVEGVALASVIAEYLAVALGVYLLRRPLRDALVRIDRARLVDRRALLLLFSANGNIFIRTLTLLFAFSYFTARSAGQGEVILAANAILMHLLSFAGHGLDGFAHAVEAMAGSAYGAKRPALFRRAVRLTTLWAGIVALVTAGLFWMLGDAIIALFTNIDSVIETASYYLPWMILMPLVSVWSFQLDGIFIGTGHTREMRNAMVASLLGYLLLLQLTIPWLGNHGLFLGLTTFMLLRAASLLFYFGGIEAAIRRRDGDGD